MYRFLFLFTVLIGCIDYRVPFLGLWDEMALIIVCIIWIYKIMKGNINIKKNVVITISLLICLIIIGVTSNILYPNIQLNKIAIVKDIVAFVKFPILMSLLPDITNLSEAEYEEICRDAKRLLIITLIVALLGYVIDIGVYTNDTTRMLKTFEFFYQHCTFFVFSYTAVLAILVKQSIEKNKIYIIIGCFLLFMTQRTKAFFVVLMVMLILIMGQKRIEAFFLCVRGRLKVRKKYLLILAGMILFLAYVIGKNRVSYYWQYGLSAARPALYMIGAKIMLEYIPFGLGFGTFASYISGESYSNAYYMYGLSNVDGLRPNTYNYVSDVYWPYIYGQLGASGLCLYVFLLFDIFKRQFNKLKSYNAVVSFLLIWGYAIFASTAEAFFTNATGVQMAIILGVFVKYGEKTEEHKDEK